MERFMVVLDRELTSEIEDYFSDCGCNVTFTDVEMLPEMLFIETLLTEREVRRLNYVDDVRSPHSEV